MAALHELTDAQFSALTRSMHDGDAEYILAAQTMRTRPVGSNWNTLQPDVMRQFPTGFDPIEPTRLIMKRTALKQIVTACGVGAVEEHEGEDVYVVTHTTTKKKITWKRKLMSDPPGDPYATFTEIEWENEQTAVPGGVQLGLATFDGDYHFDSCSVSDSEPDPPEHWDSPDGYTDAELYDWIREEATVEYTDLATISYVSMVAAASAGARSKVLAKTVLKSFTQRTCSGGGLGANPMYFGLPDGDTALRGALDYRRYTAEFVVAGRRMPFKIKFTVKQIYFMDLGPNESGDVESEDEQEIAFSDELGWTHSFNPPVTAGCDTFLLDPHIELA